MSGYLTARDVIARAAGRSIAQGCVWRPDMIADAVLAALDTAGFEIAQKSHYLKLNVMTPKQVREAWGWQEGNND